MTSRPPLAWYLQVHDLLHGDVLEKELRFQDCDSAASLLIYYLMAKPTRFSVALNELLIIMGLPRVPTEKFTQKYIQDVMQKMDAGELVNLISFYTDLQRMTKLDLKRNLAASVPYHVARHHHPTLMTELKLPFYDNSLLKLGAEDQKMILSCNFNGHPHHRALAQAGYCLPLEVPLTAAHVYMFTNFAERKGTPQKVTHGNRWVRDKLSSADVAELREGKLFHWYASPSATLIWELARHELRPDLTNEQIAEILNTKCLWHVGELDRWQSVVLYLCNYRLPSLDATKYMAARKVSIDALPYFEQKVIACLYRNPVNCIPVPWEEDLLRMSRALKGTNKGQATVTIALGFIIDPRMTDIDGIRYQCKQHMAEAVHSFAESRSRHGDLLRDQLLARPAAWSQYTDAELLQRLQLQHIPWNDSVKRTLRDMLSEDTFFVPQTIRSTNQRTFGTDNKVGEKYCVAFGRLNNYVCYEFEELDTTLEITTNDKGKQVPKPKRPDDIKQHFTVGQLQAYIRLLECMSGQQQRVSNVRNNVLLLTSQPIDDMVNALSPGDKDRLKKTLLALIDLGFYMRRWRGPGKPLPLTLQETKIKVDPETGREIDIPANVTIGYEALDKLVTADIRDILMRMKLQYHIEEAHDLVELLELVRTNKFCIRIGSCVLIHTAVHYLTILFKQNVAFDIRKLASIA